MCRSIPTREKSRFVREKDMVVAVFEHARGVMVNFIDWKWIGDEKFAFAWGRWVAELHNRCRCERIELHMNMMYSMRSLA